MMPVVEPNLILRLGTHAEKEYFDKTLRFFDGLAVNANLVEATPGATASLLVRFGGKKRELPFYIDPMTYAFGEYADRKGVLRRDLDWIKSDQKRNGELIRDYKRSYSKLANQLGDPFAEALERNSSVTWNDFNDSNIESACSQVAEYQLHRIAEEFSSDSELVQFIDKVPRPVAVYAPYFYIEPSNENEWLDLNLRLATTTARNITSHPVHIMICADSSFLLNKKFIERIKAELPSTGVKGVWFWFSAFQEDSASIEHLTAFRNLVETLSDKVSVYSRHGGFFSMALSKHGLSGLSHGVGYGEQKDVIPIIGQSTPTVRYYLPQVRRRFGVPQIERCFDSLEIKTPKDFYKKVCGCVICKGIISDEIHAFAEFGEMHRSTPKSKRLAQTPAAAKRCRYHFLLSRIAERDWIKSASNEEIIGKLKAAAELWGTQTTLSGGTTHLERWQEVLK
ncbi:hypothetical protein [Gimesia maris]|nr:hypothetical protein [Gimesia maris]QGQ29111.1 hypothetical protein F1729_10865 [Gimesia maris]